MGTVAAFALLQRLELLCDASPAQWVARARCMWSSLCRSPPMGALVVKACGGAAQVFLSGGAAVPLDSPASPGVALAEFEALRAQRAILIDAARCARRASSSLPGLRAKYPTGTDLDRWLVSLRQFSYLMREVDMVEEKLLEVAEMLARSPARGTAPGARLCRLAQPLAEGARAKPAALQFALCLQRLAASPESAAGSLLRCWPVLGPSVLSFLTSGERSAELVLLGPGLRTDLLMGAERLLTRSGADLSDDLALPGFEEDLQRRIIQGSAPGGERRSFRQRTEARRQ